MQCDEFEARLNELLDERLNPAADDQCAEHAQSCRSCRGRLHAYRAVLAGIACSPEAKETDLAARVVAELAGPAVVRGGAFRASRLLPLLPAATAALLLAASWHWLRSGGTERTAAPTGRPVRETARPAGREWRTTGRIVETEPTITDLARQATRNYRSLAHDTRRSVSTALEIVPGVGAVEAGIDDPAPRSSSGWTSGLTEGLKPLARSTSGSLGALLRAVTVSGEDSHS
jgi:hypothetical protein